MISFRSTEDENAFTEIANKIAQDGIRPIARACEEDGVVDKKLVEELRGLGFLSLELPEEWGGLNLPLITQVQVLQALSYGDLGIVQGLPGAGDTASLIRSIPENKQLLSCKELLANKGTGAFIEVNNEDDSWGDNLIIREHHDDYVLHGETKPIRQASFADYVIIANVDAEGKSVVLLLDNLDQWQVEKGDYRLGLLASGLGRLLFDEVPISKSNVIAKGEEAEKLLKQIQIRNYILEASKEVGLMEAALDYATKYTAERKAFGQEVAKFQGVSFRIAKMVMETRISRNLVWEAAIKADEGDAISEGLAIRALYQAHRSVRYVTDSAVQLLGGHGFVKEFPVEKWMRDAQAQVALYGRERDLLKQRGRQIIAEDLEVPVS